MNRNTKELFIIILTILILGVSVSYLKKPLIETTLISLIGFGIIILTNVITKKMIAYKLDIDITIKPWSLYYYGLRNDAHFKEPIPMSWTPIFFTLLSNSKIWWLAITQFDSKSKPERVAKKQGYYRFAELTEWDTGLIAIWGVITNLVLGLIFIIIGLGPLTYIGKLSIYYSAWSLLPISNLDGTKILFASRAIWFVLIIITGLLTFFIFTL
jgi:hypothetical protein